MMNSNFQSIEEAARYRKDLAAVFIDLKSF
jgi:hypothetical protein